MLNPVNSYASIANATRPRAVRDPREEQAHQAPARAAGGAGADRVTLSASGQRRAAFSRIVSDTARRLPALQAGQPRQTDLKGLLDAAGERLQSVLGDLGMASDAAVAARGNGDGSFEVGADGRPSRRLTTEVNGDGPLRNALNTVDGLVRLNRVAAAVTRAYQAAEADPANEARYHAWARASARQTLAMTSGFHYQGGHLSASLLDTAGNPVGESEGLQPPA